MAREDLGINKAVAAADRSLSLLEAFIGTNKPLGLGDLEKSTGLFKSVILRYMISFEGRGFVVKDGSGLYRLGPKAFQLGKAFERTFDLVSTVQPLIDQLCQETGETASIYVRDGEWRVCMLRSEPERLVKIAVQVGMRLSIGGSATGLVLSRDENRTIECISEIGVDDIETTSGIGDAFLASMAMPFFGPGNVFAGSLTLSGIAGHFDTSNRRYKELLVNCATKVSMAMGAMDAVPVQAPAAKRKKAAA